jgi:aminoglycoside adenylyltransferase-like protein/nucleotidyltransferase-like protein
VVTPHSTGYADVDTVLAGLLAGVRGTLGSQLVGVYLDGSLATGDFTERSSDIDLLVVTEDTLSDEVVAALRTMHARLATGTSRWARELEVSYIPRRALRCFDPDNNLHPCIQRGSDQLLTEEHDRAWVIHRHVIREHGVALAGPAPRTLIDPVDAGDLRAAVVSLLDGWWTPAPTCRRWLANPFYRSYAVLTMCRMRYTLQYGVVVSKPFAAGWAQAALDAQWAPLIQAALAWSSDIVPDLGETLRFIDDTRQARKR